MNRPTHRFPAAHKLDKQVREAIIDEIQKSLSNSRVVEAAVRVLFERQTESEKQTQSTRESNNIGLTAAHASKITYYANWLLSGKHLSGPHLDRAREICMHYSRTQLFELAAHKRGLV